MSPGSIKAEIKALNAELTNQKVVLTLLEEGLFFGKHSVSHSAAWNYMNAKFHATFLDMQGLQQKFDQEIDTPTEGTNGKTENTKTIDPAADPAAA